jgi:hypothetical protein
MVQQSSNKFSSKNTQGHGAMNIKQTLTNQPNKHKLWNSWTGFKVAATGYHHHGIV